MRAIYLTGARCHCCFGESVAPVHLRTILWATADAGVAFLLGGEGVFILYPSSPWELFGAVLEHLRPFVSSL